MSTNSDYLKIEKFLSEIANDIKLFVSRYLPKLILSSYKDLLNDFENGLRIIYAHVKKAIGKLTDDDRIKEKLKDHGLTDLELERKIKIYHISRINFLKKPVKTSKGILRTLAKRFLVAINVILDSLSTVIPSLGVVKEYKNSLEVVI